VADLTARPADAETTDSAGTTAAADASRGDTRTSRPGNGPAQGSADRRAVRAHVAPASMLGGEPTIRLSPLPEPLHMTNPTVGRGLLGGASGPGDGGQAATPERVPDAVLAQRQHLLDGRPVDLELRSQGGGRHILVEPGSTTLVVLEPEHRVPGGARRREVLVDGFRFEVDVEPERIASLRERASRGRAASAHTGPLEVRAIIPGKVVAVSVTAGDEVTAGQQLLVVEAMKMQNELRAPRDGTIERVAVAQGVNIEVGDLLVVIS
jgi:biotin carboxyl carrier protein